MFVSSHVAINHGNLYNTLLALVQGRYGVLHDEVKGTGAGVGYRNRNVSGARQSGRDVTREKVEGKIWRTPEREEGG